MKDRIIKIINEKNVNNILDLYRVVHELEIQDFKDAFFQTNKESITFDDKNERPMITITAHEEHHKKIFDNIITQIHNRYARR